MKDGIPSYVYDPESWAEWANSDLPERQKKVAAINRIVQELLLYLRGNQARRELPLSRGSLEQNLVSAWAEFDQAATDEALVECEDMVLATLTALADHARSYLAGRVARVQYHPILLEGLPGSSIILHRKNLDAESLRDVQLLRSVLITMLAIGDKLGDYELLANPKVAKMIEAMDDAIKHNRERKGAAVLGLLDKVDDVAISLGIEPSRSLEFELRLKTVEDLDYRTQLWLPVLQNMTLLVDTVRRTIDRLSSETEADKKFIADKEAVLGDVRVIVQEIGEWVPDLRLEKNDCSRIHTLFEAAQEGKVLVMGDGDEFGARSTDGDARFHHWSRSLTVPISRARPEFIEYLSGHQVFVVRHDWAAAFGPGITEAMGNYEDANVQLPYAKVVFEFRVSGHTLLVETQQGENSEILHTLIFKSNKIDRWLIFACHGKTQEPTDLESQKQMDAEGRIVQFVEAQITAICVALDTEVATHVPIRAPNALNEKRKKKGKPPMVDFHVVDLSRRIKSRAEPLPRTDHEPAYRLRAHFRRAHWRHYETHKTRIPWMLVGDPDLGFVHKFYLN